MKITFHSYANKTNFHMKSFALSLAFIVRFLATRKWPIQSVVVFIGDREYCMSALEDGASFLQLLVHSASSLQGEFRSTGRRLYSQTTVHLEMVRENYTGMLTIYMENPEIPVGKSNGTHHSIWSTSEIMGFWSK